MSSNIEQLGERLEKIKIKVAVNNDRIKSSLNELQDSLKSLDDDFISTLSSINPDIVMLKDLTTEKIQNDKEGITGNQLANIIEELEQYLESELSRYEEMI